MARAALSCNAFAIATFSSISFLFSKIQILAANVSIILLFLSTKGAGCMLAEHLSRPADMSHVSDAKRDEFPRNRFSDYVNSPTERRFVSRCAVDVSDSAVADGSGSVRRRLLRHGDVPCRVRARRSDRDAFCSLRSHGARPLCRDRDGSHRLPSRRPDSRRPTMLRSPPL